ncbi:unnamed protein product [Lactuca saligna]|uniref:Uncharacterized protein n=1 Tax=Lactuca saligna TaxID=75948 RepID=A0AA36EDH3_LACSI|nr:unnamed protein product [Lactuca saligna]
MDTVNTLIDIQTGTMVRLILTPPWLPPPNQQPRSSPPTPPPSPIQLKKPLSLPPSPNEPLPQSPLTDNYRHLLHLKHFFRLFDQRFSILFTLNMYLLDLEDEVNFKGG